MSAAYPGRLIMDSEGPGGRGLGLALILDPAWIRRCSSCPPKGRPPSGSPRQGHESAPVCQTQHSFPTIRHRYHQCRMTWYGIEQGIPKRDNDSKFLFMLGIISSKLKNPVAVRGISLVVVYDMAANCRCTHSLYISILLCMTERQTADASAYY